MHINAEPRDSFTILHLRGEFDTYYCPMLQDEIDGLVKAGVNQVVLNLRLVKFINSTALGSIIKASKQLSGQGGQVAISRPSAFCRDIIEKVGLDRVVPVFDNDEEAGASFQSSSSAKSAEAGTWEQDESSVLISPVDPARIEHFVGKTGSDKPTNPVHGHEFGKIWSGVGRMSSLDGETICFTWNGGDTDLTPFAMSQLLALGTDWRVKFRLPLLKSGFFEAVAEVSEVEERTDGVKVLATFSKIEDETREAVRQFAKDMALLKKELG